MYQNKKDSLFLLNCILLQAVVQRKEKKSIHIIYSFFLSKQKIAEKLI